MRLTFSGTGTALITPFTTSGAIDETAIRRLSVYHRTVLVLHHYADIPLERVAQILEIPLGTVYSRLHHAMRGMRAALDADARPAAAEASR